MEKLSSARSAQTPADSSRLHGRLGERYARGARVVVLILVALSANVPISWADAGEPSLTLSPGYVAMGFNSVYEMTLTLSEPAEPGGQEVNLALDPNIHVSTPSFVTVIEGQSSATFIVTSFASEGTELLVAMITVETAEAAIQVFDGLVFHDGFESGGLSSWSGQVGWVPDLVINEILQDPDAAFDPDGEWFEIYNAETSPVDLANWTISDDAATHVISPGVPLLIAPGEFLVFGFNSDTDVNGGVILDYVYDSLLLGNGSDELVLRDSSALEVDRVAWDGGLTFPDPTGASMILADPALDNSLGSNWCVSTTPFGDDDFGTPGATNDLCP